jgi:glycosyltransferase involved in cell wall biosynthesis
MSHHLALIVPTLDRLGGAERQVLLLAAGFKSRGWRVSVVTLSGNGVAAARELVAQGISFLSLEMRKGLADPRGWARMHRWLRDEAPDVVHAHLPHAAWLARWSRLGAPVPVLIDSIHTSDTGTWGRRMGYRLSRWLPNRVSAVGAGAAEAWQRAGMVPADRLIVIPNGVDVERWHPDPSSRNDFRQRLGLKDEFLWLAAGRLHPVKDYPALLRAMMETPGAAHLVIAGAGPEEGALRRLAIQSGLQSRVRFVGFQPDVLPWMQAADAFVLASRWEGLPMTLLEAGACALPAVATDVPGSREIVAHGETGYLAAPGDSHALRTAMHLMMCLDAQARSVMGEQARRKICAQFSIESVLDRWEAIHCQLLESHPRARRWAALGMENLLSRLNGGGGGSAGAGDNASEHATGRYARTSALSRPEAGQETLSAHDQTT